MAIGLALLFYGINWYQERPQRADALWGLSIGASQSDVKFSKGDLVTDNSRIDFTGSLRIADIDTNLEIKIHSSDLSELEGCYRFRTDPDLHGLGLEGADLPFAIPVIAGVCFEIPGVVGNPELAPPYGLNRREEVEGVPAGPIVTLEDVPAPFLNCGTFARTPPPSVLGVIKSGQLRELPGAAWHALLRGVARVVQPRALNAVDLGAGGSTDGFSRFGWLRSATMTKVTSTDNQIGVY